MFSREKTEVISSCCLVSCDAMCGEMDRYVRLGMPMAVCGRLGGVCR